VQLVTIFQDYGQVVARWGRDHARTILNNHVTRVLLPGMADTELLEEFSTLIGEHQVVDPSTTHGPGGSSTTEGPRWERLAPIDALRTLDNRTAVVVHANHPTARIRLRPFHEEKHWHDLGGWLDRHTDPEGQEATP
jgi:type IV secretion system protein VirD4